MYPARLVAVRAASHEQRGFIFWIPTSSLHHKEWVALGIERERTVLRDIVHALQGFQLCQNLGIVRSFHNSSALEPLGTLGIPPRLPGRTDRVEMRCRRRFGLAVSGSFEALGIRYVCAVAGHLAKPSAPQARWRALLLWRVRPRSIDFSKSTRRPRPRTRHSLHCIVLWQYSTL